MKSGKAAGPDHIPPEALKADINTMMEILYKLFEAIWIEEVVPNDWKLGDLIKISKKGDLRNCDNYRGISLLSVPGKVLNRVVLERLRVAVDPNLRENQAGFRKGRSRTDQIATLRIIIEQSIEWNSALFVNFIDLEKAFDSLERESLWKLLRHYGIPEKIVSIIRSSYSGMSKRVIHDGKTSESFNVLTGVRQGYLLSPFIFLLAMDWIMHETTVNKRNGIQWSISSQIDDLDFADDLALLSHTYNQMREKTSVLDTTAQQLGLNIHRRKTKVSRMNTANTNPIPLRGEPIEDVDSLTYLGSIVRRVASQFFLVSPRYHFVCPVPSFSEMKEIG